MSDMQKLTPATIDRILPRPARSVAEIEAAYPPRNLAEGVEVTRIAPSPTGFMHIGGMYAAFVSERLAHQTGGIFYLRLEDTDRKREVEGARELVMSSLTTFGIHYDEGPVSGNKEIGAYGPYTQSHREDIYKAYIRKMLDEGLAYPCFVTPEEQAATVERQSAAKVRPGYYGEWAVWRDRHEADVTEMLDAGKPFVIRFRSTGDITKKRPFNDLVKGQKELPENDNDIVIMKADGLPTYHLAHVVDDHLMHTTTVVRADEWFPSVMLHVQLAEALGIAPFTYGHIAPIQKMDGSSRRKLSKRKDPEANVEYYLENGYPVAAVLEYLLNQGNSAFEDWRRSHSAAPYTDFAFKMDRLPKNSGALLNLQKLDDVSREILATIVPEKLYELALDWAKKYDAELGAALASDADYATKIFTIERENNKRKDLAKFSDLREAYGFFFDTIYIAPTSVDFGSVSAEDRHAIITKFLEIYDPADSQETWFEKVKAIGEPLGFTPNTRDFRANPEQFKGSVADVAMVLRVALTGRNKSPNLYDVMLVMGQDRVHARLDAAKI